MREKKEMKYLSILVVLFFSVKSVRLFVFVFIKKIFLSVRALCFNV